jgi:hypothetical protein
MKKNYISILNVLACIGVVILHTFETGYTSDANFVFEVLIRAIAYCAVPVFFMITGATLIDYRERYDTKTFFKKRLLKVIIPLIIWSIIYFIINFFKGKFSINDLSFKFVFEYFFLVKTNPIFWFFVVIIGIYLAIPVISLIPQETRRKAFLYIIIITFVFNQFLPDLLYHLNLNYNYDLKFPLTYSGWISFIFIGYYIDKYEIVKKHRVIIYVLGIIGFLTMVVPTIFISYHKNESCSWFDEYYDAPCVLYSASVFLFFKSKINNNQIVTKIMPFFNFVASTTLGIYVLHIAIRDFLRYFYTYSYFGMNLVLTLSILTICFIVVKIVQKIPGLRHIFP